ncbi:hypothetical protein [Micromonospora aurantiaca (nom. illeg.)]|uniref:hypothetical protein n=1 Tax=Micromonospora aurantiaca (nom. illeg.) TaxID=47850 RepID=UPI003F49ED55
MPWAKFSDTSATHPVVLAPAAFTNWEPPRWTQTDLVNICAGIFQRLTTQSAGYLTDYVVTAGVMASTAGDNWQHWTTLMVRAGYLTPTTVAGEPAWLLVDDPEHLAHIRLKDEIAWERQRRKDNGDPALIIPVRLRDGDACRYCGVIVNWRDRKGGRGGTYDHRTPGQPAAGPDDLRVACQSCNGARSNHPDADHRRPPRPAPVTPFYGTETAALLAKHGITVQVTAARPGHQPDYAPTRPRPGHQPDHAPAGDPATSRTTPTTATPPPAGHRARATTGAPRDPATRRTTRTTTRPGPRPDHAPRDPATSGHPRQVRKTQDQQRGSADPADHRHTGSGSPGRGGTGREPTTPTPTNPRRRRRARRGRPQPPPHPQQPGDHHA